LADTRDQPDGAARTGPDPGVTGADRFSRRSLLVGAGALGTGLVAGGAIVDATGVGRPATASPASPPAPFYGTHQSGIISPAQDRLVFATLNVVDDTSSTELRALLADWTAAARHMIKGELVGPVDELNAAPLDTGEAVGSQPGGLSITIGYGASLFDRRFGLTGRRPELLRDLPALPNENLDPSYTGGDLCIQACSDDPLVAFHAVRNLARLGLGVVEHNWMELGFGRTASTTDNQATPRNLMGFKDGTRNIRSNQTDLLDRYVWIGPESDQPWLKNGSYLVARRIRMFIENWDRDYLEDQQNVFGRAKTSGAPLTGGTEFTTPDFQARNDQGQPIIAADAHIRLASHEANDGLRILRRGYSFTDGIDPVRGTLLGGLFFIAFMKSPQQFINLQRKLGTQDALNEYIQHTGSALFVCPPGLSPGANWGDQLFT
jgi:deferrochelatase/peroxidase EfeB